MTCKAALSATYRQVATATVSRATTSGKSYVTSEATLAVTNSLGRSIDYTVEFTGGELGSGESIAIKSLTTAATAALRQV